MIIRFKSMEVFYISNAHEYYNSLSNYNWVTQKVLFLAALSLSIR